MERVLGLIPAKGGSSRLPQKNVKKLGDKTLIEWAADALIGSGVVDEIILSTESEHVASIAVAKGIDVPFLRPDHLAKDPAGVVDVAFHAINALSERGRFYTTLIVSLPTCPFRNSLDIKNAYRIFIDSGRNAVMSVAEYSHTPFAAMQKDGDGFLNAYFPEFIGRKSQDMPKAFRPNGGVHVVDVEWFVKNKSFFSSPLRAYQMPRSRSIDIDAIEDFDEAECMLAKFRSAI